MPSKYFDCVAQFADEVKTLTKIPPQHAGKHLQPQVVTCRPRICSTQHKCGKKSRRRGRNGNK